MDKIRIVLCNMHPMMREIVRDLVNRQADMEVVGEAETPSELSAVIKTCQAEAVIAILSSADTPGTVCALQTEHPELMMLTFFDEQHGPLAWPCEGSPHMVEPAGTAVLSAIREGGKMRVGVTSRLLRSNVNVNA